MNDQKTQVVYTKNEVVITDIKMPFWSMVGFMVKWAIAAIPAFFILMVIGMFVMALIGGGGQN